MALTAALLGWMFDGFEMGLFPLIGGPALNDLLGPASAAQATQWFGAIIAVFLVGAATGGVFFGWLGDRIGRVRAMSLSIFTYAVFTGLCGFATEAWHIAALRFIASLGMGGEWSLGVALVNEIWPNKSRALIAGLIGAAANVGFLLVGLLSIGLHQFIGGVEALLLGIGMPTAMVSRLLANSGWRFLMISGALPALLVFFIRLFVPESKKWEHEKARGATSHWSNGDLLGVSVGCLASIAIIWSWSPAGIGPGAQRRSSPSSASRRHCGDFCFRSGVISTARSPRDRSRRHSSAWSSGTCCLARAWPASHCSARGDRFNGRRGGRSSSSPTQAASRGNTRRSARPSARSCSRFWRASSPGKFGRRITYAVLCVGSILSCLLLYQGNDRFDGFFLFSIFLAGGITAAFYGLFPLYLPELFPTVVRATGQGFSYNFGRILAAVGGLQTATLMGFFGGSFPMAGSVLTVFYLIGLVIIWLGPETLGKPLPE